jgi:hypothetical protein
MTFTTFGFSNLIDMGFVLLVTVACLKSLRSDPTAAERVAERWRGELRELEKTLRGLIEEASSASGTLDRRLMRRKEELETLLQKIQTASAPAESPAAAPAKSPAVLRGAEDDRWELGDIDELPNETWAAAAPTAPAMSRPQRPANPLEELLAEAEDSISISLSAAAKAGTLRTAPAATRAQAPAPAALLQTRTSPGGEQSLRNRIEIIKNAEEAQPTPQEIAEQETFQQMSIMDPTAYKIARRLLAGGTEIHVVARKLELPLSEVRLLDRLMRQEAHDAAAPDAGTTASAPAATNYKPTEVVPSSKIVRSKPLATQISREREEERKLRRASRRGLRQPRN